MSKTLVIMGSANSMGDTYNICRRVVQENAYKFQDLNELVILPYDYDHDNSDDDFLGFAKHMVEEYDHIILASPIYWYNVSGQMKVFIDRFTDLVTIKKEWGRKLAGKKLGFISVSRDKDFPSYLAEPIKLTAAYLKMEFTGHEHFVAE